MATNGIAAGFLSRTGKDEAMSALRSITKTVASEVAGQPYPCWSAIADDLGAAGRTTERDCQALKEVRLWRALADEPLTEEQTTAGDLGPDGNPRV